MARAGKNISEQNFYNNRLDIWQFELGNDFHSYHGLENTMKQAN